MSQKLNGKLDLAKGVFTIDALEVNCRYGGKSFPGAQAIADYSSENPSIKTFALGGTGIEFPFNLAVPTIGTKVTAGNKVINGVDPKFHETVGGGGGGGGSRKFSARVDGKDLIINDGTSDARISAEVITLPATASNVFAAKVAEVSRKAREGNFDLVKTMVGKPHLMAKVASIALDAGECESITPEARTSAIAALAGEIQKLGKLELFAQLGTAKFELVGGEISAIETWAKAHMPNVAPATAPEPSK